MTEAEWKARYDNIMQDIAKSKSMGERQEKVNYYNNELFTMKESGLPVENDIAYLMNGTQVNTVKSSNVPAVDTSNSAVIEEVQNNQSIDSQATTNVSSDLNSSPEEAWKARYDNIMQDIANSKSMGERQEKVNYYNNELFTMKESGLPVENDIAYLMNGTQVNTVESSNVPAVDTSNSTVIEAVQNNQSIDSQATANVSSDSNSSPEEAWKARYDNIMQDIANSKSMGERQEKVNYYNNELFAMKDSGLAVDNDLTYLGVQLGEKVYQTPINGILNQNLMVAERIKKNEILDGVINHPDKIKEKEVAVGALQVYGGFTEIIAGGGVIGVSGGLATAVGGYMAVDGASNMAGGLSKINNGLKGLDSSNGGGDTYNFVKNGYKEVLPKDGICSGENVYNGTQVLIAGKTIKDGITGLPKAIERTEELFTRGGSLVGRTVDTDIPKLFQKVGEIGVDLKNGSDAKDGLVIPKTTFDVQGYLDAYIKLSDKVEDGLGQSQNNIQQGKSIVR